MEEENNDDPIAPIQMVQDESDDQQNEENGRIIGEIDVRPNFDSDSDSDSDAIQGQPILGNIRHFLRPIRLNHIANAIGFRGFRNPTAAPENDDLNDGDDDVPEGAEKFDIDLPAEHSYLGNRLERVSGVMYLEPGKQYRLLVFMHHSLLFPGQALPMIIPEFMFDTTLTLDEGMIFGTLFPQLLKNKKPDLYGVTCQIYEKGTDNVGNIIIKSQVHQRFVIKKSNNPNFSELLKPHHRRIYAVVTILPEVYLPDPLLSNDLGSMNRFRDIESISDKLLKFQASTTAWPQFVYKQYDVKPIIEKAKRCLSKYSINSMPNDMVLLSHWLARNLMLDSKVKIQMFLTNSVNVRMKLIENALDNERYFCCRRCRNKIALNQSLFAMSKHGIQSNYCNPSGFIHETNTVSSVLRNSVYPHGAPSTEFSWFPGYSWQIILCQLCDSHIGWKFVSTKKNLIPRKFYGLSGTNTIVHTAEEENNADPTSSSNASSSTEQDQQPLEGSHTPYLVFYGL